MTRIFFGHVLARGKLSTLGMDKPADTQGRKPAPDAEAGLVALTTEESAAREEQELVLALQRRDARALGLVFSRYQSRIYSFLLRLCGRGDVADDLFQETFVQLARYADRLRPDTNLSAWLYTVARNRYRSYRRARLLHALRQDVFADQPIGDVGMIKKVRTPLDEALLTDEQRQVEQAMASLGEKFREVLLLVGVDGLTSEQAAQVLGITPVAVRQRLSRARGQLTEALRKLPRPDDQGRAGNT